MQKLPDLVKKILDEYPGDLSCEEEDGSLIIHHMCVSGGRHGRLCAYMMKDNLSVIRFDPETGEATAGEWEGGDKYLSIVCDLCELAFKLPELTNELQVRGIPS